MARTTDNGEYPYPENGWSTGKMRKRGQKPEPEDGEGVRLAAMNIKPKGMADWGLGAEIERAAGIQMRARGGVTKGAEGLSPDVIQQHKSQIQAMTDNWISGNIDWKKWHRQVKDLGWDAILDIPPQPTGMFRTRMAVETEKGLEGAKKELEERQKEAGGSIGPVESMKMGLKTGMEALARTLAKGKLELRDPEGEVHEIPISEGAKKKMYNMLPDWAKEGIEKAGRAIFDKPTKPEQWGWEE